MNNYDLQVDMGKRIFLEYDQEQLIQKFRLEADEQWIYLSYMNTPSVSAEAMGALKNTSKTDGRNADPTAR